MLKSKQNICLIKRKFLNIYEKKRKKNENKYFLC